MTANRGGESAAQDSALDGGEGTALADQPTTASETQSTSAIMLVQQFYGGMAPIDVASPEDRPGDELDDGPETTEEPADRETAVIDASPPGLRDDDDDGVDDSTLAVTSTPAYGGLLHHLQQTEGLPNSVTVPSFVVRDIEATDIHLTFSETGETQPS